MKCKKILPPPEYYHLMYSTQLLMVARMYSSCVRKQQLLSGNSRLICWEYSVAVD